MTRETFVPDEQLPDIRPGDVVRLKHGQLTFTIEKVERTSTYACASLRPVVALTASAKKRACEYRRTDGLVLLERPADSQPLSEIPWDQRDLDRQLVLLERDERRRREDERRLEARLGRLRAAGVQIEPRDPGTIRRGEVAARLKQWRNGADVVTRLEYEDTMPAPQLLRLVKHVEDILDDFAADTGEFSTWLTSHRGEPWRGVVWEGASGR
ncbi:hypothetical protein [Dermacoccus sp. BD5]|uniref:hypothetical protein n=1 Tax=Dermacoccus sp. BD5 TaxID=2953656 RepID=UPI00383DEC28